MTFEEYVSSRGPALMRLARLLAGDEHRAEDLTQEVLTRAYVHWRRIVRSDRPDVYVRRMLVNAHNSWWRRRSNRELAIPTLVDRPHSGDLGGEAADRDEMWRLIAGLPDRQRAVLVLRYYEDLDDATIAEILGCSQVTVRTHAMRALATLRERSGLPTTNGSRP
ncbi:SigE family RNA polymerase sigma factor [Micromonospora sp. 15K316]|uniref:SigE family RNA polymerase sigma factor n=1 Tax=Micromonospora sp. 15K316 TaxID=2530376 RepID=UPI00105302BD|nr:SigE family RNA polymerase sigma factor [Micromonospora sp. 15K316]TDC29366.1 SigE family RNA polymerase sigma factor [Micromonospora sp. 15K316]